MKKECSTCSGSGRETVVPKFSQLVSTEHGLFALAEDGTVWVMVSRDRRGWTQVSMAVVQ